jgi:hypothetical protein
MGTAAVIKDPALKVMIPKTSGKEKFMNTYLIA